MGADRADENYPVFRPREIISVGYDFHFSLPESSNILSSV